MSRKGCTAAHSCHPKVESICRALNWNARVSLAGYLRQEDRPYKGMQPMTQTSSTPPEEQHLQRNLTNRHIQLIAIGGAIGTGLFMAGIVPAVGRAVELKLLGLLCSPFATQGRSHKDRVAYWPAANRTWLSNSWRKPGSRRNWRASSSR